MNVKTDFEYFLKSKRLSLNCLNWLPVSRFISKKKRFLKASERYGFFLGIVKCSFGSVVEYHGLFVLDLRVGTVINLIWFEI